MNISQPKRYGGTFGGEPADIFDPRHYENVREPFDVARALPAWCFTSEAFYERELQRMFMCTWNCIGHVDRIPNPGDYFAIEFARVPIVVVRDETGAVRAFSNSCRHRGSVIAEGEGNVSTLQCPYHNWTYALDGALIGMPHVRDDTNCKMSDNDLIPVRLETWAGMMFVNFDSEAAGLLEWLGDLPAKSAVYEPDEMVFGRRTEYELKANWKLFAEGNMEGYHVFCLHKDTLAKHKVSHRDAFGRDDVGGDVGGEYTSIYVEHGATRGVRSGEAFPEIEGVDPGTWFFHIFPASLMIFGVDSMSMTQYYPLAVDRTLLVIDTCYPKSTLRRPDFSELEAGYQRDYDAFFYEDIEATERQFAGLSSPLAVQGHYVETGGSDGSEECLHAIDNWVLDRVLDPV